MYYNAPRLNNKRILQNTHTHTHTHTDVIK